MAWILWAYAPILEDTRSIVWVDAVGCVYESHESNITSDLLFSILAL